MTLVLVRPLMQWLHWQHQYCCRATLRHLLHLPSLLAVETSSRRFSFTGVPSIHRNVHFRSRGLKLPKALVPPDFQESNSDISDPNEKKSRNEKKREARRAVRWGMELATFSTPQIKRILRVASMERQVFDAIMLVKRLGRDVKEGKRRQFNYIGRLLREVEPQLMDGLIQATKDGDQSNFQALCGSETWVVSDDDEEVEETEYEDEEEGSHNYIDIATRWFDGLINKDVDITKEIYSVQDVDFERQELRRLVREVHSMQERQVNLEENEGGVDMALIGAERSLTRFLRTLAKKLPTE